MSHLVAVGQYVSGHWLGVILAIVASYAIGFLWHGPLFGKLWLKLSGLQGMSKKEGMEAMLPGSLASIAMAFVQAAVIGRMLQTSTGNASNALVIATMLWIPFTALVMLNSYVWTHKKIELFFLDAGYTLVSLWAITLVVYATL